MKPDDSEYVYAKKVFDDFKTAEVVPLTFGRARIAVASKESYADDSYDDVW